MKTELWLGPNNDPFLPEILKFPVLTIVHALNRGSTDKMINFINQYWWENINKATKSTYFSCPTYPKYNPGQTVHRYFQLSNEPFEVWQMDFIQLPHFHGYECVLVICVFSTESEPFHVDYYLFSA